MAKKQVARIKKTDVNVPQTLAQADILLGELGKTQNKINEIEFRLKKKIDKLKSEAAKKMEALITKRDTQINSLFAFASSHKAELTQETRSIKLISGTFGWRMTPLRVELKRSEKATIAFLKKTGNAKFVRIIEEVNRQALLDEKPTIKGIDYVQDDEFFATPIQKFRKPKTLTHAIDR